MNRIKHIDRSSVWLFLVILTVCSFAWSEKINSIGILLLSLHWILDKNIIQKIKSIRLDAVLISSISFFIFHIIAISWSGFKAEAGHSIEVKLSFFILPILFSTENYLNTKYLKQLLLAFCISCLASFIYCLCYSFYHFYHIGINAVFNRMNIADGIMHPGYYSNYFVLGIIACSFDVLNTKHNPLKRINIFFITIFSIILILLVSKTALIYMFVFSVYIIWKISNFIKNISIRIASFIALLFLFGTIFISIPQIKSRIKETQYQSTIEITKPKFSNSTESRRAAWKLEWELIKKSPIIGYGTGSSNPLLIQKFKEKKYSDLIEYNMHTHNQIFHTWIDLGLVGIVLLMILLISCLLVFIKQKSEIGISFLGLVLINICTDDMLEIQAGIVFFIFFLILFVYKNNKKKLNSYY